MNGRKRNGIGCKVDPSNFPIREQGPETGLSFTPKNLSKTRMDKNSALFPSVGGSLLQQKKALRAECLLRWWTGQDLNL